MYTFMDFRYHARRDVPPGVTSPSLPPCPPSIRCLPRPDKRRLCLPADLQQAIGRSVVCLSTGLGPQKGKAQQK
jgi:hypothetical protein